MWEQGEWNATPMANGAYHVEGICDQGQTRDVIADAQLDGEEDSIERHHDANARRLRPALHFVGGWRLGQHTREGARDEAKRKVARGRGRRDGDDVLATQAGDCERGCVWSGMTFFFLLKIRVKLFWVVKASYRTGDGGTGA